MSSSLFFVSSNKNKFKEASTILSGFGISIEFFKCKLQEIQTNSLEEVAQHKARQAFSFCSKPVIIEDDGLFISVTERLSRTIFVLCTRYYWK
ncbi:Xanthosine/inosine triphosphate pyrophosphatase [Candidatus Nitrosotalea sp. TS]|uniref:non-canonical purine NTP pyrophosphatase n=1 Tax=Candidatus Nitrosotalea sp. TS TaxID=2341020 RepID=UPI001EBA5539|nr:non-canonical purine NTP pyrophosphatase [Candidatus Nitrosotalea sp. TS]NHI04014.1 Xanthosine/inosine triphosphate pyrophosphatase [Candidatus Nitrosotalea sp. TS]